MKQIPPYYFKETRGMNLKEKDRAYSFEELQQFQNQEVQQIFESPIWSEKRFRETSLDFSDTKKSCLFLRVFTKIVTYDYPQFQIKINEILLKIASENYFSELIKFFSGVNATSVDGEWIETLENLVRFLHQLLIKIPTSALSSLGLCTFIDSLIPRFIIACNDENTLNCLESIQNDVKDIRSGITEKLIIPEIERRREPRDERKPPNDFRKIPILPTRDDIFNKPFLRKNLKSGSYENLEHYLDVQFRLLREDCIAQLRSGIYEFIEAKTLLANREIRRLQDVKLYKNVVVISKESSLDGPLYELKLDSQQVNRIKWERSKRLLHGSLLCLSPDDFDTLYLAVIEIADHDKIKEDCKIKVTMKKGKGQPDIQMGLPMTMVESSAYFESYRHVLASLQTMTEEDTPFKRYIVEGRTDIKIPKYVEMDEDLEFDLGPIINQEFIFKRYEYRSRENKCSVGILSDNWPSSRQLHVDESQLKAFKFALTKEFVIIQGPPGTGKTHIGLQIAKALLHNKQHWASDRNINENASYAILIVCYTNHALDQFMEGIVNLLDPKNEITWGRKLVRVGSRCTNPKIESFSLKGKRRGMYHLSGDHEAYFEKLKSKHAKISKIKWILTQSMQNILDTNDLNQWIEVETMMKISGENFNILKWLGIDEESLFKNAYHDYERYEFENQTKDNVKTKEKLQEQMEKIIVDTEAKLINAERHVEDDDFEDDYKFEEIGHNIDSMVAHISIQKKFDGNFEKLLKEHANRAKLQVLSKEIMKQEEIEKTIERHWKIPIKQRWRLYRSCVNKFREEGKLRLEREEKKFLDLREMYLREKQKLDREILMQSEIIAMTTSGAARYQDVLKEIGPRVIIVEEAAEVLEAHIIATLNPNCEHLILIGDHKQLEPKPAVFELAEKYNLSLSMFERMINVGLPYVCLERQHRMRPEISQLVRPVYENLFDNENVLEYEDILGIEKNLYFISHNKEESKKDETQSYWNNHEASYIHCLTRYLLLQGYKTSQITILTPYSGQMFLLREMMPRREFEGIKISILDNYQGEENDIILLSLVRSNKEGKIGFLNRENRVCVALSRAKIGLYVIGNFDNIQKFSRKCKLWGKTIKTVGVMGAIGEGLPLICRIHSTRTQAKNSVDFNEAPEGGCSLRCDIRRQCGHACPLFCHPRDPDHKNIECKKSCSKRCDLDHTCTKQCHFPSDCMCNVPVEKILPCRHKKTLPCFTAPETVKCMDQVIKDLPCGHSGEMHCYENPEIFVCKQLVERILDCGHIKEFPCHFNHMRYKCKVIVRKKLPCEHEADMHCSESVTQYLCKELVHRVLKCSHEIDLACHINAEKYKCMEKACKKLICGHECEVLCHESVFFITCKEKVTEKRTISLTSKTQKLFRYSSFTSRSLEYSSKCDHFYTRYCHESARDFQTRNPCEELIKKTLDCGHEIEVACHLRDDDIKCETAVMTDFQCHHENISIPCHLKASTQCRKNCGKLCERKHTCQKICHFPTPCVCRVVVRKQNLCGHISNVECSTDVSLIPCEEPVQKVLKCGHGETLACKVDVNNSHIVCLVKVVKELKCNHRLALPCNVDPDDVQCMEKVEKVISSCGHNSLMSCFKNPENEECQTKVNYVRPECGHETKIWCYQKKQIMGGVIKHSTLPLCETEVKITLPCGHVLDIPCHKQKTDFVFCMKPCKSVLLCGHLCSGTCSECKKNHRHKECQEICTKALVCGHNCTHRQCGNCDPCSEPCNFGCSHGNCRHPCNKECVPCTKQCDRRCKHYKCSKLCFENCDRPKCHERCTERLKCGHQCIGLCGDPCPKLCKKCDHSRLMKITKVQSHLFVELQECGHIFKSVILDDYMEMTSETFTLKRCPKCTKIIKWHPRYHVELQNQRLNINKIRNSIQTVSDKVNVSTFPVLLGSGDRSNEFLTKIRTFLSANEQSLKQVDTYGTAKVVLGSLEKLLQDTWNGNQRNYSIYSKLMELSLHWKLFIAVQYNSFPAPSKDKLKEDNAGNYNMNELEFSDDNSENEDEKLSIIQKRPTVTDDDDREYSKPVFKMQGNYKEFESNLDLIKKMCLQIEDENTLCFLDIEEKLKYFLPFLTDIGKGWTETANKFPRLIAAVDVHIGSWKMCPFGHLFSCMNGHGNCLSCYGFDRVSLSDFQNQRELHHDYNRQGARPKVLKNQSRDDPFTSNHRNYQKKGQNQRGKWNNMELDVSNRTSGKYENNRNRGRRGGRGGGGSSQSFLRSPEVANVYTPVTSNVPGGFRRGRGFHQNFENTTGRNRSQVENVDEIYSANDFQHFQHRNQSNEQGGRYFEPGNGNQQRGKRGRGRGSQRGGRRGRR